MITSKKFDLKNWIPDNFSDALKVSGMTTQNMNKILIIGSGGREHALAWKLKQSPKVEQIFIAPGNAGTATVGENLGINPLNFDALIEFAKKEKIGLTVCSTDDILAAGIVDAFRQQGLKIWGASKIAAQIEASKAFAKNLMRQNNIPTANYEIFTNYDEAIKYTENYFLASTLSSRARSASDEPRNPLNYRL